MIFIYIVITLVCAIGWAQNTYRINNGSTTTIDRYGTCREITNNSGKDIMVPTKTQVEWESFVNNAGITGVVKADCSGGPPPVDPY